ncbi:MAG: carboxylating nicotinate-nucleotide diphosphorylase [Candidatus Hydrogenedentes bacterium]|nr:carboxylating nicotinate-nucleotide diphosphorylase [Candidatus Hydrogenedentota bacterium]
MYTPIELDELLYLSLQEDIGLGDKTTNTVVSKDARCKVELIAKADGIVSGLTVFKRLFELQQAEIEKWQEIPDGSRVKKGDVIVSFEGNARAVLSTERVALNFLMHLSGVATLTSKYVERVKDLPVRICHTRKTTPLLRALELEAVVHGGGYRHRFNLSDGILIKENHLELVGGNIATAVKLLRKKISHLERIEVEVKTLEQLKEALESGADAILLDNMSLEEIKTAVKEAKGFPVLLEASGNMTLERVRPVAETGVHIISVGAITHSAPTLDLSVLVERI